MNTSHATPQTTHLARGLPPTHKFTCDQLGICQGRTIPCLNCTQPEAMAWPGAEEDSLTPIEQISYWAAIALACGGTVGVVAGVAGYVFVRWIAP